MRRRFSQQINQLSIGTVEGAVRNVVGIIIGVISEKLIIAYYAASSIG